MNVLSYGRSLYHALSGFRKGVSCWVPAVLLACTLTDCAHAPVVPNRHSGTGLFPGLFDPGRLMKNPSVWDAYVGDRIVDASGNAHILYGARMNQSLAKATNSSRLPVSCPDVPCALDRAKLLNARFLMTATVRKESPSRGSLVLNLWSISPPRLEQTLSGDFPLGPSSAASFKSLVDRMTENFFSPLAASSGPRTTGPDKDPGSALERFLNRGQVDQAVQIGTVWEGDRSVEKTPLFNLMYMKALWAAGRTGMARRLASATIEGGRFDVPFVLEAVRLERLSGHPRTARAILYKGLVRLPDSESLWARVIEDRILRGHPEEGLTLAKKYLGRHPGEMGDRMAGAVYAAYEISDDTAAADRWWSREFKSGRRRRSLMARHAWLYRQAQEGSWDVMSRQARKWLSEGYVSEPLYRDLMMALGALSDPIQEVHVGRKAIREGFASAWIRDRVRELERKGY